MTAFLTSTTDIAPHEEPPFGFTGKKSAEILRRSHQEFVRHWAENLKNLPGSNYGRRPLEELQRSCDECLTAYEALLEQNDSGPLWTFVERICEMRVSMNFPPSELTEAFMLCLEAADAVLSPTISDAESWESLMKDLRHCTRTSLKSLVNTYLVHLELQAVL